MFTYKLFFATELNEAIAFEALSLTNVAGLFNTKKSKIILFSTSSSKMISICKDAEIPLYFIDEVELTKKIDLPGLANAEVVNCFWAICIWGGYGDRILAKFDNLQLSLFPDETIH